MKRRCSIAVLPIVLVLLVPAVAAAQDPPLGVLDGVSVDQRLNEKIPEGIILRDESGQDVRLGDYFRDKPVVLSLVYYECPMLCSLTLTSLVETFRTLSLDVGKDFDVLTISFDPSETPEQARLKKQHYVADYGRPDAAAGWHFLTGTPESIKQLTSAVGFRYAWDPRTAQWAHASVIAVLTPDMRISQYLYGIEFSPRDLRLSLIQASEYRIGTAVDRLLLYCYQYDPVTGKYGFVIMNVLRLAAVSTVFLLGLFIVRHRRA